MKRINDLIQIQQSLMTELDALDLTQINLETQRNFLEILCKHLTSYKNMIEAKLINTHGKLTMLKLTGVTQ